jgi:hypothetical protein
MTGAAGSPGTTCSGMRLLATSDITGRPDSLQIMLWHNLFRFSVGGVKIEDYVRGIKQHLTGRG